MSGLAQVYAQLGHQISGSDSSSNEMTQRLAQMGVKIFQGHDSKNVENVDLVVVSSAIARTNPEILEAQKRSIPIWHRSQLLVDLMSTRDVIAVAGTHGKTTTSSMIFSMILNAGLQPTAIIGGKVKEISSGATLGEGLWLVAEADESDKSFLQYSPRIAVINNIEADHLENYDGKIENIISAFKEFIQRVPSNGWVIFGIDDPNTFVLQKECQKKNMTFGLRKEAQVRVENIELQNFCSISEVYYENKKLGNLELHLPGLHNIQNALASIAVGMAVGLPYEKIRPGLETFGGVDRRFQKMGEVRGITVIDDYAHNPAKVAAAISAAKTGNAKRVIAVFQPHRFSRTKYLGEAFGPSFDAADMTILTEIYPAGEYPIEGISSQNIYEAARKHGYEKMVYIPSRGKINDYLMPLIKSGDLILFMGAGDIWKIAGDLVRQLENQPPESNHQNNGLHIKGSVQKHEPMKKHTYIRVGGEADTFVTAENVEDLKEIVLYAKRKELKLFPVGAGSNLLVLDDGIEGIVVKLGKGFAYRERIGKTQLRCGGGVLLPNLARYAAENGLSGLEELVGIPASVGGAVVMNAGAHSHATADVVEMVNVMTFDGQIKILKKNEIEFGYHTSNLKDVIVFEALFNLIPAPVEEIKKKIQHYLEVRNTTQPVNLPSAGCIFRNPHVDGAGKLIDRAGLKETRIGGAMISPKHANFFVNAGNATAQDFLELIQQAQNEVKNKFNVDLDLEVRIVGRKKETEK